MPSMKGFLLFCDKINKKFARAQFFIKKINFIIVIYYTCKYEESYYQGYRQTCRGLKRDS